MEIGGFQKTVLFVAIGILSVSLFWIAILLMKEKRKKSSAHQNFKFVNIHLTGSKIRRATRS